MSTISLSSTLDELTPIDGFLGQDRAITALRFGVEIEHDSYHLFALGPSGLGKHDVVQRLLAERASQRETPSDWCYVHNFDEPHRPNAIALPVGRGLDLQHALDQFIEELQSALPAAFEGDDYRTRRQAIEDAAQRRQEEAFEKLCKRKPRRKTSPWSERQSAWRSPPCVARKC